MLTGVQNITCVTPWSAPVPECIPVDCGDPGEILHGSRYGKTYTYRSAITYNCTEGYHLNETTSTIICGPSGTWNGSVPLCIAVDCGDPGMPTKGSREGDVFEYRFQVQFQCSTGFELNGTSVLVCGADGLWNATTPTCIWNTGDYCCYDIHYITPKCTNDYSLTESSVQSTVILATTLSIFCCIAVAVAFVTGTMTTMCYQRWKGLTSHNSPNP